MCANNDNYNDGNTKRAYKANNNYTGENYNYASNNHNDTAYDHDPGANHYDNSTRINYYSGSSCTTNT